MSTGGGNERETVAGISLPFTLTGINTAVAELLSAFEHLPIDLRNPFQTAMQRLVSQVGTLQTGLNIPVDFQINRGTGDQIQRTIDEAANKLKLSFQALGRPDELQTALRGVQSDLEAIVIASEKAGQSLNMSLKGPAGEGSYSLRGKQDVGQVISRLTDYGSAVAPTGGNVTLGLSATVDADKEGMSAHAEAIRNATSAVHARSLAEIAAEKQTKKTVEEGERLSKWLEMWSSGGRPQRALGAALQGPLSNMFGAEAGAGMAGLGAMVGGGLLFHAGWEIINQIGKIPERIGEEIAISRHYGEMRAAALTGPTMLDTMPTGSPEAIAAMAKDSKLQSHIQGAWDILQRRGIDPKRYETIMATLLMQNQAEKIGIDKIGEIAGQSLLSEMAHPMSGGKAEDLAYTRFRMLATGGGSSRAKLAGSDVGMDALIAANKNKSAWFANLPREQQEAIVQRQLEAPATIYGNTKNPVGWSPEAIDQAMSALSTTEQMEAVGKEKMGQYNYGAWRHENPILFSDYSQRSGIEKDYIKNAEGYLKTGGGLYNNTIAGKLHDAIDRLQAYGKTHRDDKGYIHINPQDISTISKDLAIESSYGYSQIQVDSNKTRELLGVAAARAGVPLMPGQSPTSAIFGTGGGMPDAPALGQPRFSFSSLSDLANNMQTEAGSHLDYASQTAENTKAISDKIDTLNTLLTVKSGDGIGSSPSQSILQPATY